jgi:D-arabinose 1-dehydrogenase-like Zn-dependent alcohol dehydrogenase
MTEIAYGAGADIEISRADQINLACERMLEGEVKYRAVIANATMET